MKETMIHLKVIHRVSSTAEKLIWSLHLKGDQGIAAKQQVEEMLLDCQEQPERWLGTAGADPYLWI